MIMTEEHSMAVMNSADPNESFDSVIYQEANSSTLTYLGGAGDLIWNPKNSDSLIVQKLVHFRDINVVGTQHFKILNDIRILSLSFIFVYGHTSANVPRLCEYLQIKDCSALCKQVEIPLVEDSEKVMLDLFKLQKDYYNNVHNLDNFTCSTTDSTGLAQSIILNFHNASITWNDSPYITESQFSKQSVFPLILPLFVRCRDYEISKCDKLMPIVNGYKPDLSVILKLKFNPVRPGYPNTFFESDFMKMLEIYELIQLNYYQLNRWNMAY